MKLKAAQGPIRWWMNASGFRGITLPWAVYIHPDSLKDHKLIAHEKVHVQQIERMGVVKFYLLYLWYSVRFGYRGNPLEIEAREKSSDGRAAP